MTNFNSIDERRFSRLLPEKCRGFGSGASTLTLNRWRDTWSTSIGDITSLLVLGGSKTAEIEGVSAAGSTKESRRYTAVADAELLLKGPSIRRRWPLPKLPGGVSPALISYVASRLIGVKSLVAAAGLFQPPSFPCLMAESPSLGPSECLTTGKAMDRNRVERLWENGVAMGKNFGKPLLLAECVPGGTTTALAALTGLGLQVGDLISSSNQTPPTLLKKNLVAKGLKAGRLGDDPNPKDLLAAIGDPFQPFAVGLLIGARQAKQPVLLGGGSQMAAVLAIALSFIDSSWREDFVKDVSIGTTAWLADELIVPSANQAAFPNLLRKIEYRFDVPLLGLSAGLHFLESSKQVLRDYELGFIKEGVGAGAFTLLAQNNGISCKRLLEECELAVDQLMKGF